MTLGMNCWQSISSLTDPGTKDWRLLITDWHNSRVSNEFMISCAINRVFLCVLPAHISHVTQPLDVGIFSVLKGTYHKFLEEFLHEDVGWATNLKAQKSNNKLPRHPNFKRLWPEEVYIFFALLIYFGIFNFSKKRDYWRRDIKYPYYYYTRWMSRGRFNFIYRWLTIWDPENTAATPTIRLLQ
jgi:hypothetical protein